MQSRQKGPFIILFNAKVGEGRGENVVGLLGLGIRNIRGEKFIEWGHTNNLIIGNTTVSAINKKERDL